MKEAQKIHLLLVRKNGTYFFKSFPDCGNDTQLLKDLYWIGREANLLNIIYFGHKRPELECPFIYCWSS
jgi:hypothetical protein